MFIQEPASQRISPPQGVGRGSTSCPKTGEVRLVWTRIKHVGSRVKSRGRVRFRESADQPMVLSEFGVDLAGAPIGVNDNRKLLTFGENVRAVLTSCGRLARHPRAARSERSKRGAARCDGQAGAPWHPPRAGPLQVLLFSHPVAVSPKSARRLKVGRSAAGRSAAVGGTALGDILCWTAR